MLDLARLKCEFAENDYFCSKKTATMATSNSIFSNYHPNGHHINPSLLWEYDISTFDWQRSKTLVAQRVVELGWPEDFYGAFDLYGLPRSHQEHPTPFGHRHEFRLPLLQPAKGGTAMLHKETVETSTNLFMVQGNFNWRIIANRLHEMTSHPERHFKRL